jgi:hypothetical protein
LLLPPQIVSVPLSVSPIEVATPTFTDVGAIRARD